MVPPLKNVLMHDYKPVEYEISMILVIFYCISLLLDVRLV